MTCERLELPGGGVAIVCSADKKPVKRPKQPRCSRCREPFTPPRRGMQTICPQCVEDLS